MDIILWLQALSENFLQSHFYAALKIFFGIYTVVLILDIILVTAFRDIKGALRQGKYGTALVPTTSKSEMDKLWEAIEKRVETNDPSQYAVAIIEADAIVEKVIGDIGYQGADMGAKLEQLRAIYPEDAALLEAPHQLRNRVVLDEQFRLDREQTLQALNTYKTYLKKFDYFA